ncbi:hypothetical protein BGZ58_005475 [Dissophora ornata]|nr:hypothetical protein BGZ58_005475 [Dissophora ornata]
MMSAMAHKDNEPLLPLMEPNSGHPVSPSKQQHNQSQDDDIMKPSKLSGSTVHDSASSSVTGPEDSHRPLYADHKNETRLSMSSDYDYDGRSSISDDDDHVAMLEAQKESAKDKRRLLTAIALCGTFFLIELVGAMWSGSLALLSDSFHLMTDITSFVISLTAIYLSQRPSTAKYTFGFHRAEVLGALISIFLIWGLTLMLVVEAIGRLRNPINVDGKTMSVVAAVGVCVNISLMFVLGGNSQPDEDLENGNARSGNHETHQEHAPLRSDDDLDQEQKSAALRDDEQGPKQRHVNLNMTAATLHVLGDLLSSIGVLTSSLIITFYPSLTFLDPVCTFVFSIMVIATTVGVFKNSVAILMERVPQGIDSDEIKDAVCDIPGVLEVKSLHVWSLTTGKAALAGTVYLQPEIKDLRRAAAIVSKSRGMIKKQYGIKECTIQVALYSPHAQALSQQRRFQRGSTKTALSKNDQDVVFSIGDDDLDEMISPSTLRLGAGLTHSQFLSQDITRSGTPLSMYRKNRHASDDEDDSENEMTTEIDLAVPLQIKPSQWV